MCQEQAGGKRQEGGKELSSVFSPCALSYTQGFLLIRSSKCTGSRDR